MTRLLLLRYLIIFFEVHFILFYLLELKKEKKIWILNTVLFPVLLVLDLLVIHQGLILDWAVYTLIAIFLTIVVLTYSLNTFKKIPIMIFAHLFASLITTIIGGLVMLLISVDPLELTGYSWYALLGELSGIGLLITLCFITKRMKFNIDIDFLGWKEKVIILFLTVIFGFLFVTFQRMEYTGWSELMTALVMLAGIIALFNIIIYTAKETRNRIIERNAKRHVETHKQQEIHYEILRKKEKQTATFIHDADKLLLPLIKMVDAKELTGDLALLVINLQNTTTEIKSAVKYKTGSEFIDGHLQYLLHKYRHAQIEFILIGGLPENHRFDVEDIISLFSNLLENAFEAVAQVNDNKKIEMGIDRKTTDLYIRIENGYQGDLKSKNIGFETTKADKRNHGIGMQVIYDVVEKYNGNLKISTNNNNFIVEITFPRTIYKT